MRRPDENVVSAVVVSLTKGHVTIIDPEDADEVLPYLWHASGTGHKMYARRNDPSSPSGIVLLQRAITGAPEDMEVNHLNGNSLDNRRCNLVVTDRRGVISNAFRDTPTGHPVGVHYEKDDRLWRASIKRGGIRYNLGRFKDQADAVAAYQKKLAEFEEEVRAGRSLQ